MIAKNIRLEALHNLKLGEKYKERGEITDTRGKIIKRKVYRTL